MRNCFVETENVKAFLRGVSDVRQRGASEASLMLADGAPGYGKSRTGLWWATHHQAVLIRMKAAATPHWLLTDLVRELGEQAPGRSCEKLFEQAYGVLARTQPPLVIDEVEHTLHDLRVIETLRDLSDLCEIPVILVGREFVEGRLRREKQVWTRISAVVSFKAATLADVRLACDQLSEVPFDDDVVKAIHAQSEGRMREIVKAISVAERLGRRGGGQVTGDMIRDVALTNDFQRSKVKAEKKPDLKVVKA